MGRRYYTTVKLIPYKIGIKKNIIESLLISYTSYSLFYFIHRKEKMKNNHIKMGFEHKTLSFQIHNLINSAAVKTNMIIDKFMQSI